MNDYGKLSLAQLTYWSDTGHARCDVFNRRAARVRTNEHILADAYEALAAFWGSVAANCDVIRRDKVA